MADISILPEDTSRGPQRMTRFAAVRHLLLLGLAGVLILLAGRAIFGSERPQLFGASDSIALGATIIAVAIVMTGLIVAMVVLYVVELRAVASIVAEAKEAKRHIERGRANASAIERLREKSAASSLT